MSDELVIERIARLTRELGRKPKLDEVFHRDFTGTGKYRVLKLGRPPRGEPRGRKRRSGG